VKEDTICVYISNSPINFGEKLCQTLFHTWTNNWLPITKEWVDPAPTFPVMSLMKPNYKGVYTSGYKIIQKLEHFITLKNPTWFNSSMNNAVLNYKRGQPSYNNDLYIILRTIRSTIKWISTSYLIEFNKF